MVLQVDEDGNVLRSGDQGAIGGDDRYVSMCRKHFLEAFGDFQMPE